MRTPHSSHPDRHTPLPMNRVIAIAAAHPANRRPDNRLLALSALCLASAWMSLLLLLGLR